MKKDSKGSSRAAGSIRRGDEHWYQVFFDRRDLAPNQYAQYYPGEIRARDEAWIRARRAAPDETQPASKPVITAGLAVSGGGERSATFCLGVLQALARRRKLRCFDFLSSVSGGGYTASCLAWLYHHWLEFPFGVQLTDARRRGGRVLAWLRSRGKYLTPGSGIGGAALISALLGAIFVNLFILVPVFMLAINLLDERWPLLPELAIATADGVETSELLDAMIRFMQLTGGRFTSFTLLFIFGLATLSLFLIETLLVAWFSGAPHFQRHFTQRQRRRNLGKLLLYGSTATVLGAVPMLWQWLVSINWAGNGNGIYLGGSVSGAVGTMLTLAGRWLGKNRDEGRGLPAWLYRIGLALLVFGLLIVAYHLVAKNGGLGWRVTEDIELQIWLVAAVLIAIVADINHVSMHRYYRNRLMETYLSAELVDRENNPDTFSLQSLDPERKGPPTDDDPNRKGPPMLIINTNMATVGSCEPVLQQRGGANFVFTPRYHGCQATGYRMQEAFSGDTDMDLATAMAISGAAVNPNNYFTRSRPLSFLMSLLNLRLGYWFPRPTGDRQSKLHPPSVPWYYYMFSELFGRGLHEKNNFVHLSDGGHFENLGIYELIRRRCKYILLIDAGMDNEYRFTDLARAIELARVDFGVYIDIDVSALCPDTESGRSARPYAIGRIDYGGYDNPDSNNGAERIDVVGNTGVTEGRLLYVKSSFLPTMSPELESYRKEHDKFPHEPTSDQFFDEQQFEVYRELGYIIGRILRDPESGYVTRELLEFWKLMEDDTGCGC